MDALSPQGVKIVEYLAQKYNVSTEAVMTLLNALMKGRGTMAQFNHPELGGLGQWSQGGMTMVGDMFNSALKAKVEGLCSELADLLAREDSSMRPDLSSPGLSASETGAPGKFSLFVHSTEAPSTQWWGVDMGVPTATGAQNDVNYAYFRAAQRLAIKVGDQLSIYDTGDHDIGGISQQQSGDASLTFTSQHGLIRVGELHLVSARHDGRQNAKDQPVPLTTGHGHEEQPERVATDQSPDSIPSFERPAETNDAFVKLERLADLNKKGIISDAEFTAKKRELLDRI